MNSLDPSVWRDRCAKRFAELDAEMSADDARQLAQEVWDFERTRAMAPEEAADFVAREISVPGLPRFERRSTPR